jgi:hypothetical protein
MRLTQSVSRNVGFNLLVFLLVLLASFGLGAGKKKKHVVVSDRLLAAICMVESGCNPDVEDGDNGKAKGMYQIWESFHTDSVEFDPSIGGSYEDVKDKAYAEKIIRAYMQRYAPDNATDEQIARIFNAGPRALTKKRIRLTDEYWAKVKEHL